MKNIIELAVIVILAAIVVLPQIPKFLKKDNDRPDRPAEIHKREKFWICESCGQEFRLLDEDGPPVACPQCGASRDKDVLTDDAESGTIIRTCPECRRRVEMLDGTDAIFCPYCGKIL